MSRFDEALFALKLQESALRMHAETASKRRRVQFECREVGRSKGTGLFLALVNSDLDVLRKYLEGDVDRICRAVWQTQGNPITPDFVRTFLVQHVFTALEARVGSIRASIERMAARMHLSHSLYRVHRHLIQASNQMKFSLSNQYEIEARELEWKHAGGTIAEKDRKEAPTVRRVSQAPAPATVVSGLGLSRVPKSTQVPEHLPPHYPNDLKPQTRLVLGEAVRRFPVQTQTLELCRYVVSELTPYFSGAVQNKTLRADRVEDVVNELLHYIVVSNCDSDNERFRIKNDARKSDEWLKMAKEIVRVTSVERPPNAPGANPHIREFTPHIPLSNPLTAHDAGESATIDIASFMMRVPDRDSEENSGAITGLSYNTLYFVYFDDPMLAGMTSHRQPPELPDIVNFSLPAGCTHADVIQEIAKQLGWSVESLPDQLRQNPSPKGRTVFGSARAVLNQIATNYEELDWTIADGVLRVEMRDPRMDSDEYGAATYNATTAKENVILVAGRFFVGSIRTPAKSGPSTIGNGDGGTFQSSLEPPQAIKFAEASTEIVSALEPDPNQNKRKSFVMPILEKRGLSILDWANDSNVDFHTANDYLKGKTKPFQSTRKKLAHSLGVKVEELPK